MMCTSPLPAMPHVKAGRLRALGMTGAKRSRAAPELPTIAEQGVKGYESSLWYAMLAPAATPQAIIKRVHAETVKIVKSPELAGQLLALGAEPVGNTPQELSRFIKAQIDRWTQLVGAANIRIE
jgi:tripartite-type tricarboxylate transporter receptor subunit TctC